MPIFWKAMYYLKIMNLKVISATANGVSPNRKCYRMHIKINKIFAMIQFKELRIFTPTKNVTYIFSLILLN